MTITIHINDNFIQGLTDATAATPERDRKSAAVIMAAMDTVVRSMADGFMRENVREIIAPTIKQRMEEAGLVVSKID